MAKRKLIVNYEGRHDVIQQDDGLDLADVKVSSAEGNQLEVVADGLAVFGYRDAVSGKQPTAPNSGNKLSTGYIEFKKGSDTVRVNTLTTDITNFRITQGRRLNITTRKLFGPDVSESYNLHVDLPVPRVLNLNVSDGIKRKLLWCDYKKTWEYWATGDFQASTRITLPSTVSGQVYTFGPNPVLVTASAGLGNVAVTNKTETSLTLTVQNPGPGTVKLEGWH